MKQGIITTVMIIIVIVGLIGISTDEGNIDTRHCKLGINVGDVVIHKLDVRGIVRTCTTDGVRAHTGEVMVYWPYREVVETGK